MSPSITSLLICDCRLRTSDSGLFEILDSSTPRLVFVRRLTLCDSELRTFLTLDCFPHSHFLHFSFIIPCLSFCISQKVSWDSVLSRPSLQAYGLTPCET